MFREDSGPSWLATEPKLSTRLKPCPRREEFVHEFEDKLFV